MWLHVPSTQLKCPDCQTIIMVHGDLYINEEYLESGRLRPTCSCGYAYMKPDFEKHGAYSVTRPSINRVQIADSRNLFVS
jgi:hypothetical protein